MVQLKVECPFCGKGKSRIFQFLMVQLKDIYRPKDKLFSYISIPYGSIKSDIQDAYKRDEVIFQFLMVQLKDIRTHKPRLFYRISIPYGSIKSLLSALPFSWSYEFQFLMVQLKVPCPVYRVFVSVFQFLMVQLKVTTYSLAA